MERKRLEVRITQEGPERAIRHIQHELLCDAVSSRVAVIPAGKSGLIVLDEIGVNSVLGIGPKIIALKSGVEGVHFWPIDNNNPKVDPDMDSFGWLLDPDAATYEHAHGFISTTYHNSATAMVSYATLPSIINYAKDRTQSPINRATHYVDQATSPKIHQGDVCYEFPQSLHTPADSEHDHALIYFQGMDDYWNLGTENDDLAFGARMYFEDKTKVGAVQSTFYCYPFTSFRPDPDDLPDETPLGDTIWATDDRNLCLAGDSDSFTYGLGWYWLSDGLDGDSVGDPGGCSAAYWRFTSGDADNPPTTPPADNGWTYYELGRKADYSKSPSDSSLTNCLYQADGDGQPTWSRVTALRLGPIGAEKSVTHETVIRFINLWFGPRAGRLHTLRPHAVITDNPWSTNSKVAIGFQNHQSRDATIELAYGWTVQP